MLGLCVYDNEFRAFYKKTNDACGTPKSTSYARRNSCWIGVKTRNRDVYQSFEWRISLHLTNEHWLHFFHLRRRLKMLVLNTFCSIVSNLPNISMVQTPRRISTTPAKKGCFSGMSMPIHLNLVLSIMDNTADKRTKRASIPYAALIWSDNVTWHLTAAPKLVDFDKAPKLNIFRRW
jgi:hypothetical protein